MHAHMQGEFNRFEPKNVVACVISCNQAGERKRPAGSPDFKRNHFFKATSNLCKMLHQ
jgi:hypothetical protein